MSSRVFASCLAAVLATCLADLPLFPQQLSTVTDSAGVIIVESTRLASQISLFDDAGVFIRDLGGRGEGPGEFQTSRPGTCSTSRACGWARSS